jgi:hypothetical protein
MRKTKTRFQTKKNLPWSGWKNEKPGYHEKTVMLQTCGKKCFLGTNKTFPICTKNTCTRNRKGVYAAYVRSKEYMSITKNPKYKRISKKARRVLKQMPE